MVFVGRESDGCSGLSPTSLFPVTRSKPQANRKEKQFTRPQSQSFPDPDLCVCGGGARTVGLPAKLRTDPLY